MIDKEEAWKWYLKGIEADDRGTKTRFENLWEEIGKKQKEVKE